MKRNTQLSGCLSSFFAMFFGKRQHQNTDQIPKVQISNRFISNAEADFFRVLTKVVGNRGHILAQISLKQLLYLPGKDQTTPGRRTWQNKINQRSLDFLICDPATLQPRLAIELDDSSHTRPDRQTRDEEVLLMLEAAGLPIVRILCARNYDTRELTATILPHLAEN
jgi:hypothetical protein